MNIIEKYKKHKKIGNLWVIIISMILAFAINIFVINNEWISNNLKTNLLESEKKQNIWDIYLEKNWNDIIVRANNIIKNITNISLSVVYNPENIEIKELIPRLNSQKSNISNTPWVNTIILEYTGNNDILAWEEIFRLKINKKEDNTENINIISANFTDISGETFELQTTWIMY